MKNIIVIDGAVNCAYSIFEADDSTFQLIFPAPGQDVEFIEDLFPRLGEAAAEALLSNMWKHRINKAAVQGIHGTLFYGLECKREFYPTKRESDLDINRSR